MEILRDESVVEILSYVHKALIPYYTYYANMKGLMNFDSFSRFCTDFGIFPDILNKSKIMKIFTTLSSFYQSTCFGEGLNSSRSMNNTSIANMSISEPNNTKDVIDEHLFVEALALTAFEVNYREPCPNDQEKVRCNSMFKILIDNLTHGKTKPF